VLSFVLKGWTTAEVGKALNAEGIAVRTGHHCAQPILRRFGVETTVRPSLAFYNTTEEIDRLAAVVQGWRRAGGVEPPAQPSVLQRRRPWRPCPGGLPRRPPRRPPTSLAPLAPGVPQAGPGGHAAPRQRTEHGIGVMKKHCQYQNDPGISINHRNRLWSAPIKLSCIVSGFIHMKKSDIFSLRQRFAFL
jgi:hypothetical protein